MLDIGGWEFLVIAVVALMVIGPKDLPAAVRTLSAWMGKARELAREFRGGLDELQREVELDRIRQEVKASLGADEMSQAANTIRNEIQDAGRDLGKATEPGRQLRDEWEEAYTYFQDGPPPPDSVEAEALRRLSEAEAEERAAALQPPARAPAGASSAPALLPEPPRPGDATADKAADPPPATGRAGA